MTWPKETARLMPHWRADHGVAETSVTNYLAWARRRLRALVTERLRGVTSSERELHEEMRRVWS